MRELKFRAWDKITNTMCVIWDISWTGRDSPDESINYVRIETDGTVDRGENEVILMQYTGLKDKHGKEIYEGDIVNEHCRYGVKGHEVKMEHVSGSDDMGTDMFGYIDFDESVEIIGNIYENPELLK